MGYGWKPKSRTSVKQNEPRGRVLDMMTLVELQALSDRIRAEQQAFDAGIAYEAFDPSLEFADSCCQKACARMQKIIGQAIQGQK